MGCAQQEEFESDQVGNFEALWTIMDEHYSFFDYKQVDWNEVHSRYRALVSNEMTDRELFDICGTMLKELRDGHTNLIASHDVSRYWIWEQWPVNYDERLINEHYLNFDYKMASGIRYQILPDKGNVSRAQAEAFAKAEYDIFNRTQPIESDFDREVKRLVEQHEEP